MELKRLLESNLTKLIVPQQEILVVKEKDSIPSIDNPKFVNVNEAKLWLEDTEPVITLNNKAYPIQIMMWHEVVNDGHDVVSYCPLCSSSFIFDNQDLEFGVSGLLRNSNLIMYDRDTKSLWQQFSGFSIGGEKASNRLMFKPASVVSFKDFYETYPNGLVLSRNTGYERNYGATPYVKYDDISNTPSLFIGTLDNRLPPMTIILGVGNKAYTYNLLRNKRVSYDKINNTDYVIFYKLGTNSALDTPFIKNGKDVGATGVFIPKINNQVLTFRHQNGYFIDSETNSTWTVLGKAIDGKLKGSQLTPVIHADVFWFPWAAFYPNTELITN
ncbi:DUF3179 domain-containing protein [Mycoplasmatota bacterium]|nr:DUF3179 domain-containing protein [Mycoplasmatota bacterium]